MPSAVEAGRRLAGRVAYGARTLAARSLYEAKTLVARSPGLAIGAARVRGHGVLVDPATDILIEGYPRSANAFAVAAFRHAQGREVRVAHHTHAPAHVLAAMRAGVPALVLIREPAECVLEFVIVRPNLTVRQALRGWVRFYAALLPHREGFVVGPFPEVTSDFGAVIRRVNQRFGTRFLEFEHTEATVRELFRHMDDYWRDRLGPGRSIERFVGRPSQERERWKAAMRADYAATPAQLRERAEALYRAFAGSPP
ncbi:MAG TPA: hypothetical protein VFC04_01265 [Actinomycetota bacterium]|nr:hypothetical protein [Actinomycetota bacterium]